MKPLCCALFVMLATVSTHAQMIIAHRGASADAPENTIPAFELAFQQGADGIEADFYLTRDGQVVCMHDKDTKRTSGVALKPHEATLDELRALDVGRWFDERFAGLKMPALEEVLAVVPPGKKIFIEIKCGPEIVPALKRGIERCSLKSEQMVIICFKEEVVAACRRELPGIKAQLLMGYKLNAKTRQWGPSLEYTLEKLRECGATGLDAQARDQHIDETFVAALRKDGYEFHCWTVNEPEVAQRFKELGVDSITTDKPGFIHAALRAP